ncbi:hypothetical protein COY07_05030 [Candidatus Peregrinibacteria bacterium CG_4_10_14_0_2_um_filter_43_11]|nr:MAG: hypothetical protein COY07_05030 [Candidatus Peregrinibacteria bacterium CG_4_10_14_0_2_um_filter_43_11]
MRETIHAYDYAMKAFAKRVHSRTEFDPREAINTVLDELIRIAQDDYTYVLVGLDVTNKIAAAERIRQWLHGVLFSDSRTETPPEPGARKAVLMHVGTDCAYVCEEDRMYGIDGGLGGSAIATVIGTTVWILPREGAEWQVSAKTPGRTMEPFLGRAISVALFCGFSEKPAVANDSWNRVFENGTSVNPKRVLNPVMEVTFKS